MTVTKKDVIKALSYRLKATCRPSKACKDSKLEHIILMGNQRIDLKGKSVWSSKKYAEKAINNYIIKGNCYMLSTNYIYRSISSDWYVTAPEDITTLCNEFRKKWAEQNLRVVPLRDYMVFEHNREKHGKK